MTGLWQLYSFSVFFGVLSISMYGVVIDPCLLVTGKSVCKPGAEVCMSRIVAVECLYIGALFFVLAYINKDNAPKLKSLANMATMCTVALIIMIVFFGPTNQGGFENSILHFLDLIGSFILLAIMISAIHDNSETRAANSPMRGLGVNSKTFVFFLAVLLSIKIIFLSEFVNPSNILSNPGSVTAYSHLLWKTIIVMMIIILFPLLFALVYGDDEDQEIIIGMTVLMMIVSLMSIIPLRDSLKNGVMTMGTISLIVISILALIAIYVGRSSRRHDYESVM